MNAYDGGSESSSGYGTGRHPSPRTAGPRAEPRHGGRDALPTALQAAVGAWLLIAPAVLEGPSALAAVKDVLVGSVLLVVTAGAAISPALRSVEGRVCAVLGVVLIVGSVVVEFGSGSHAAARQWNEVVMGVALVCLGSARAR